MTAPDWQTVEAHACGWSERGKQLRALLSRATLVGIGVLCQASAAAAESTEDGKINEASEAITALDVQRAAELLRTIHSEGPRVSFERARLALYRGDCSSARAILSAPAFAGRKDTELLLNLAEACAGTLSDAVEIHVEARGVLLRVQDDEDQVLAPFIAEVADKARDAMKHALGAELPTPLRIDLVRDNYSLSAVTGLPLTATETTGTVAVARWGRVAMISPRAAPEGYPWQDTLAHEIVHLALTQATGDHAPLWLQEGLAKLSETAWRQARAFDGSPNPDRVAAQALARGTSVGIESIGPSVAMLPSPEQASIAYAEVESFTLFWISVNGRAALELLLRDIRGLGAANIDPAMVSVTGYPLNAWIDRWRQDLRTGSFAEDWHGKDQSPTARGVAAAVRIGDLLAARGHNAQAASQFELADSASPGHPAIRWRLARSLYEAGSPDVARERLGSLDDLPGLHAGWLAMRATLSDGAGPAAEEQREDDYATAVGLHPYLEEAACRGDISSGLKEPPWATDSAAAAAPPAVAGPSGPNRDSGGASAASAWAHLCAAARRFPSD